MGRKTIKKDEPKTLPIPPEQLLLELGKDLIPLVDKGKGAELLERIQNMRRSIFFDMGIVLPKIRIVDNTLLDSSEYCLKISTVDAGRSTLRMGCYLCINPGTAVGKVDGEETKDPAFGLPALWIAEGKRDEAEQAGYTVADHCGIMCTHLTEIIKRRAAELLGRQEIQGIIDSVKEDYPAVVNELLATGITLGSVRKVMQGLLKERVSIRNTVGILEAIADSCLSSGDIHFLVERVRQALASQICSQYADKDRTIHVLTLEPSLEQKIIGSQAQGVSGNILAALEPELHKAWIQAAEKAVRTVHEQGHVPVILCPSQARYLVKSTLERELPEAAVLSVSEIHMDYSVVPVGVIALAQELSKNKSNKKGKTSGKGKEG
ncbi:MAG: flagellar biosynthesis protein FlhA [Treponema sp.]|nr:flagellar biosynthesis protein FlhA [Treponema sp.]